VSEAAAQITLRLFHGEHYRLIANDFAIHPSMVYRIAREKCWQDAFLKAKSIDTGQVA
jgi:hypothetical protein